MMLRAFLATKLLIDIFRMKLWGQYFRKTVKIIIPEEYIIYANSYNKAINDINNEIKLFNSNR